MTLTLELVLNKNFLLLDTYAISDDVMSRFWFTYRNGFAPIGRNMN